MGLECSGRSSRLHASDTWQRGHMGNDRNAEAQQATLEATHIPIRHTVGRLKSKGDRSAVPRTAVTVRKSGPREKLKKSNESTRNQIWFENLEAKRIAGSEISDAPLRSLGGCGPRRR